jgi:hypothetical protein
MQLKKSFKKGCQFFVVHMEEATKDKVTSLEDHPVLRYFQYFFEEIPGLPPKRDIDFSFIWCHELPQCPRQNGHTKIERVADATRGTLEEEVYTPKCVTLGSQNSFCKEEG